MDPAVRALLGAHDDATGFEVPGNDWSAFPYQELKASVVAIQAAVREELGLDLARDGQVQDASFHDEVSMLHPNPVRPNAFVFAIAIRFLDYL